MASSHPIAADKRLNSSATDWSFTETLVGEFDAVAIQTKPMPKEKYPAKLHARGVAKRLAVSSGLVYIPGLAALNYVDSDQPIYFRQHRYFYYMSGIDYPGCYITYDIQRDKLYAWIPPRNLGASVIYNGPNPSPEEIKAICDVDEVDSVPNLHKYLSKYTHGTNGKVYFLHEYQCPRDFRTIPSVKCRDSNGMGTQPPVDFYKLKPAMDAARVIKSPYEIKLLRKANEITAHAHINVLRAIKNLKNEADIEAVFTAACTSLQAKKQAYGIIAGSGANASTLHYMANNEPLEGRQLVCLDAGCEWKCYASDVTRTFPISGDYSPEAQEIYDIVAQMQKECINMVKPGANYRDIHMHAHKVATKRLMELGLLKGTFDELYRAGASLAFFPHGLGHYLGLECHDVGVGGNLLFASDIKHDWTSAFFSMLNNSDSAPSGASVLAPNMVITVEPGIYFSRYALEEVFLKDKRYAKFINKDLLPKYYPVGGVRIEDDILVTEGGYENLTTAPKGEEALKIINGDDAEMIEREEVDDQKKGWFW